MSKRNKTWMFILVLASCMGGGLPLQAASAERQLQKGIEAYQKNNNDKALEYFVDVLMNGDNEQVAQANRYIEAIHNNMGGIKTPVEVNVNFPDQPTQTLIDRTDNLANYGVEKLDTLAGEELSVPQGPKTLTQQIEERQLAGYLDDGAEPVSAQQGALLDTATVLQEQNVNGVQTTQQDVKAVNQQLQQESKAAVQNQVPVPQEKSMADGLVSDASSVSVPAPVSASGSDLVKQEPIAQQAVVQPENLETASVFADLTTPSAIEARNLYTTQKLQSMTQEVVSSLTATPGVHLYLREDGRPDAIDVDDEVLFHQNTFRTEALPTLNNIYELMALTQNATYVILPEGSYTDDVTLPGIRQAMALHSYLVKRGISQGKLSYNMGLVDQEVPAQFSNLKGLSVVFDYDAKLPTRLLDNQNNETTPLLSMAIVPPCKAIDRTLGEAFAIDFSVLETLEPLDNWSLQVIQHGRDGNYYVVRQLEGFAPVYHQILWNGRKGIIGPELPCGKYTVVLNAVDAKGSKQTLRRRLVVKCNAAREFGSCEKGTCAVKEKETSALNYQATRLWKKPGRTMPVSKPQVPVQAVEDQQVQEQSTASNTYTVTKTVSNIVTEDNTPVAGAVSSSQEYAPMPVNAGGYAPVEGAATNPYDMPYEEEYTTY